MDKLLSFGLAGVTYRQEMVRCGKSDCARCPHGPYWYAYHKQGVMLKKTYVGKKLPAEVLDYAPDGIRMRSLFEDDATTGHS